MVAEVEDDVCGSGRVVQMSLQRMFVLANNLACQRRMMFIRNLIVSNDGSCLFNHPS